MRFLGAAALVIGGLLPLAATVAPADAATVTFDWTLTGPSASLGGVPFPGSGTITATTSAGGDSVTAITGTINGSTISGLTTFDGSDNLVFPNGSAPLDTHGIAFTTAAGQTIDILSEFAEGTPPTGNAYEEIASNPGGFGVGTFALTPTPLPAALPLYAGGLVMVSLLARRRKRNGPQGLAVA
jgi:hypothetical protein